MDRITIPKYRENKEGDTVKKKELLWLIIMQTLDVNLKC